MPKRSNVRGNLARLAVAACFAFVAHARAQLLDFGSGAPEPGSGASALALAQALHGRAQQIEDASKDNLTSAAAAKIALRRLAAAMLTQGEHAGPSGSARIVTARRIAERLDRVDAALDQLQDVDPARAEMIRAQAMRASATIPEDAEQLDRMTRRIFAQFGPTGQRPPPVGWTPGPTLAQPNLNTEIAAWERDSALSESAIAALKALETRLTSLERWSVYHDSIAAFRLEVRQASLCLNLDPRWIGQESKGALVKTFDAAIINAADANKSQAARAQLHSVTLLTAITPAVQSLASGTWTRPARDSLAETIKGRGWAPANELRSIELLARAIRQLQQGDRHGSDTVVIRQLRPAWRMIIRQRSGAKESVMHAFSAMLASPNAETDPAVLAALNAHARTIADLELLIAASDVMSQTSSAPITTPNQPVIPQPIPVTPTPGPRSPSSRQPVATATWQRPANVFLDLGQRMGVQASAVEAHEQLRSLAQRVASLARLPGETSLDANEAGWNDLLNSPTNSLAAAIDAARMQWVLAMARDGALADASRLQTLHDLMELLDAARIARQYRATNSQPRMNAWPGWSLSPQATSGMLAHVRTRLPQLVSLAMRSDPDVASDAISEARAEASMLLLFAALDQRATQASCGPEPTTPAAAVWSLAAGPPAYTDTFLVPLRADLALVCRYAEEAFAAPAGGDAAAQAASVAARTYCNEIAGNVLEQLDSN